MQGKGRASALPLWSVFVLVFSISNACTTSFSPTPPSQLKSSDTEESMQLGRAWLTASNASYTSVWTLHLLWTRRTILQNRPLMAKRVGSPEWGDPDERNNLSPAYYSRPASSTGLLAVVTCQFTGTKCSYW